MIIYVIIDMNNLLFDFLDYHLVYQMIIKIYNKISMLLK